MTSAHAPTRRRFAAFAVAFAALVSVAGAAEARGVLGPEQGRVHIEIDKSQQRMTVYVDGEKRHVFRVSTGRAGFETPRGAFRPLSMHEMAISRKYGNTPMPHSIFFTGVGHAIHATTAVGRLGRPASHGCIRLAPKDAAALYALVAQIGMKNTTIRIV